MINLPPKPNIDFSYKAATKAEEKIAREVYFTCRKKFDDWYDNVFKYAVEMYRYSENVWSPNPQSGDTHTAVLINVRPIKKETAEDLLKEFIKQHDRIIEGCDYEVTHPLIERARKIVEGRK